MKNQSSSTATYHYDLLVVSVDGVAVDHADNGHAQVTPDTKRDAEADAGQDGNDVASRQAKTCAVYNGQVLLLHQLGPSLRWELDGLAIFLLLLKSSVKRAIGATWTYRNCRRIDSFVSFVWEVHALKCCK